MLIVVMDYGRNMSSNRLVDILDDEKKVAGLNEDYHYRQSVFPRLEKLRKLIWDENIAGITNFHTDEQDKDLNFVQDLKSYLNNNPHRRITKLEMKKCNQLWRKYK
jgi:hypothetical protein